jgi:O-antigen ligase
MAKQFLLRLNQGLFVALVVFIPFLLSYWQREPLAVSYLNLASVSVIALTALSILLGQLTLQPVRSRSLIVVIGLMAAMLAWGTIFSEPLRSTFGPWTSRFLQPVLVGYCGYLLLLQDQGLKKWFIWALWVGLALVSLHGLLQWIDYLPSNNTDRLTGVYSFPNSFARYIEILLLLLAPVLVFGEKRFIWAARAAWLVGLFVLLGTESYAGVASLVAGLLVMILCLPPQFKRQKIAVMVGLVVAATLVFGFRQALPKYQATISSSIETRQQFWQVAWSLIKQHPLTGIGLEGWEQGYYQAALKIYPDPIETVSAQPHNIYLDALLRAGVIGLVAVGALLFWPIVAGARWFRRDSGNWLALGLVGYGVAMMVFGLVDDPIFSDDAMMILFIAYFSITALVGNKKSSEI